MAGRMSRDKGARAERELFALLSDELGFVVRRNVDHARAGGADGIEIEGIAVEVKRHERAAVPTWWRQTCEQAKGMQRLPILFYRKSREPWRAVVPTSGNNWAMQKVEWDKAMLGIRDNMGVLK